MWLDIAPGLIYLKRCFSVANAFNRRFIKRFTKFILILKRQGRTSVSSRLAYNHFCKGKFKSAAADIRFTWRLFKSFSSPGWADHLEYNFFKRKAIKRQRKTISAAMVIPSSAAFINSCVKLINKKQAILALGLAVMLASGRRQKDISRLRAEDINQISPTSFIVKLSMDKTHDHSQCFTVDFQLIPQAWAVAEPSVLGSALARACEVSRVPFQTLDSANMSRKVGFRPHSLRSLASIYRCWLGWDDSAIMEDLGWASIISLKRYRGLAVGVIRKAESMEQAVDWLKEK